MSIRLMSVAWDMDLPQTEKMVLLCLCDFANDEGVCWPSIERLARKCSVTDRTVRTAIGNMERKGFLYREKRLHETWICHIRLTGSNFPSDRKMTASRGEAVSPKPSENHHNNKTKRALPENWEPDLFQPNSKSGRIVMGWSHEEFAHQSEAFAAHHRKLGNKFECWQSAWSTWVLNSEKFKAKDAANGKRNNRGGSTWAIGQELLGEIGQG